MKQAKGREAGDQYKNTFQVVYFLFSITTRRSKLYENMIKNFERTNV